MSHLELFYFGTAFFIWLLLLGQLLQSLLLPSSINNPFLDSLGSILDLSCKFFRVSFGRLFYSSFLGILVGWLIPAFAPAAKIIADMYINLIRMVIAPVIFVCLVLGMSGACEMKKVGRIGGKAILYFEIITTFTLIIGLVVTHFI